MLEISKNTYISREFADEYISSRYRSAIKDWSSSADESADFDDDSGQKELVDAFESGAQLKGSFYLDDDTFLVGDCYVESLSIEHAADGKADVSISLAGSKAVTLTVPTPVGG